MRQSNQQRLVLALLLPTIIMVVTALFLLLLSVPSEYWGLPIAISMLLGNFILIYILNLSYDELGLVYKRKTLLLHILGFLLVLAVVMISFAIAKVDITKSLAQLQIYQVIFFIVAAFADEIYFRGIIYRLLEIWDGKTAFMGSSLIFGFWTIQVTYVHLSLLSTLPIPSEQIERIIFALVLGSLRYNSKMIFLAIPMHILLNIHNQILKNSNIAPELVTLYYLILLLMVIIYLTITEYLKRREKKKSLISQA